MDRQAGYRLACGPRLGSDRQGHAASFPRHGAELANPRRGSSCERNLLLGHVHRTRESTGICTRECAGTRTCMCDRWPAKCDSYSLGTSYYRRQCDPCQYASLRPTIGAASSSGWQNRSSFTLPQPYRQRLLYLRLRHRLYRHGAPMKCRRATDSRLLHLSWVCRLTTLSRSTRSRTPTR